jgi:hypothetical protein
MQLWYAAYAALLVVRARLSSPTLNVVTSPYIRDVSLAVNVGNPQIVADYSENPLTIYPLEELAVLAANSAATSGVSLAVLGLMVQYMPAPAGQILTIRGTGAGTLVVNTWTNIGTITWQNTLPSGMYSIIGGEFFSAGATAGRFIVENQVWRPGGLGMILETNRTDKLFRHGRMGVWGTFHSYAMPTVEMISASADTAEVVYMDIIKTG